MLREVAIQSNVPVDKVHNVQKWNSAKDKWQAKSLQKLGEGRPVNTE